MGLLRCPAPTRLIRILPSWKVREEFNQLLCLGFSTNAFALFDTIRSPCSISFEPPRSLISGLRLKQFPKLFYSQNSRMPETQLFQALFSRRKVFHLLKWLKYESHFLKIIQLFYKKIVCLHSKRSSIMELLLISFIWLQNLLQLRLQSSLQRCLHSGHR